MTVQVIKNNNEPEWAVIPYEEYQTLIDKAEMLQDIQDYDSTKAAIERGDEEIIPGEVIHAILDGENALKVWRQYRGLSQAELAGKTGISVPYLSQLESNKRRGSLEVLSNLSKTLHVDLEALIPARD